MLAAKQGHEVRGNVDVRMLCMVDVIVEMCSPGRPKQLASFRSEKTIDKHLDKEAQLISTQEGIQGC